MNDTEILDQILTWLKPYVEGAKPIPPESVTYALTYVDLTRGKKRKNDPLLYTRQCTCGDDSNSINPSCKLHGNATPSEHPHPYGSLYRSVRDAANNQFLYDNTNIKPQAERDDWFTARIDPYDDRIRALEKWHNSCTPEKSLPKHTGSCGNQNPLNPNGAFEGAAECGCQAKSAPLTGHMTGCDLDKDHTGVCSSAKLRLADLPKPDPEPHKHEWSALRPTPLGGPVHECLKDGCKATMSRTGVISDQHTPATPTRTHDRVCYYRPGHSGSCSPVRTAGGPYLTAADVLGSKSAQKRPQEFWRCKHYPSAIDNWWDSMESCLQCTKEPTWDSNGMRT